ncbi:MAG: M20/M25/M40 family metallo-hydrolase [Anaerolineales bacterium]|nr:M20/M25/M40 family metallo-hydrolase [Anaerolineales bacterium]MDP6769618.1 M20/M25/M40 family metallo-hydrolase [Anaerolineales bacterium]
MSNEEEQKTDLLPPGSAIRKVATAVKEKLSDKDADAVEEKKEAPVITKQSLLTSVEKKIAINDIKLLREMFSIYSPSGDEHAMVAYVSNYLTNNDIKHQIDSAGNIYFKNRVEGSDRIIVNAHMDTVANAVADVGVFKTAEDIVFKSKNNQVIGGDDKCGVFAVLKLITDSEIDVPLTALLTVAEESGCNGVRHAMTYHLDYFFDCNFWITIDRRGNSDIITENCDYQLCADKIISLLGDLGADSGWSTAVGSISDVSEGVVSLQINGINLASGYYGAHTGAEKVSLKDLRRSIDFLKQTLIPKMYSHFSNNKDDITWEPTKAWKPAYVTHYSGVRYFGVDKATTYNKPAPSNIAANTEWEKLACAEDALALVMADIESIEGWTLLDDLMDCFTELTNSKKSIRFKEALPYHQHSADVLDRYLDIQRHKNDISITLASIDNYVFNATKETSVDSPYDDDSHYDQGRGVYY